MASPPGRMTADMEIMEDLFRITMKGEWDKVVNIYRDYPSSHNAKITRSGDTALHIAVTDGKEDIVEELVRLICQNEESNNALKIENERGNTPLHLAASLGSLRMCECIANVDSKLVGARNHDSETPFFLAALHGNKDAFLCLHSICGTYEGYSYCRRKDGETILHCAIAGDYFDLAYQIIIFYDDLVNFVDEQGFTPLHLLARKPFAFRSGCHLSWLSKIIYHCILVDELKPDPRPLLASKDKKKPEIPENYQTCVSFFRLLRNTTGVGFATLRTTMVAHLISTDTSREDGDIEDPLARWQGYQSTHGPQRQQLFPSNYDTCFLSIKFVYKAMLVIFGLGTMKIIKLQNEKEKHTWSVQIMNELLRRASMYEYEDNASNAQQSTSHKDEETKPYAFIEGGVTFNSNAFEGDPPVTTTIIFLETNQGDQNKGENIGKDNNGEGEKKNPEREKKETPILTATKNGVVEMVEKILELFPVAIHDMNLDKKNIVLLAVENRQSHIYQLLLKRNILKDIIFRQVDNEGNSALHLAAMLGASFIPGPALKMQWEIKWYEFVKDSVPPNFITRYNKNGQTPEDVFTEKHKELFKEGSKWLTETSNSCFLVATIITTVTFASSATVPGGIKEGTGVPTFEEQPAFFVFAISSLIALCFSVISLITYLSILTSPHLEKHFGNILPKKYLLALTSLIISIVSMLVSFCSSHFFVLREKLKLNAYPLYGVSFLVVTLFVVFQFPLYFDFMRSTFSKVPQRSLKDKARSL